MAVSGFEGFEKRLELNFSGDDPAAGMGLRRLDFFSLEKVLHAVQCTVVSAVGNRYFDSYVLSESSLFVYPNKIIIKTCTPAAASFSPRHNPTPTQASKKKSCIWKTICQNLSCKKASVMNSKSCYKWHVFTATDEEDMHADADADADDLYTVEICMTELDRVLAKKFFRRFNDGKTGDSAGKEMTEITGIRDVNRNALICDYAFDPCGYSMNGLDGNRYLTVHVTPEDGFSYASFECVGSVYDDREEFFEVLQKVVKIFRPAALSVSTTCPTGHEIWRGVAKAIEPLGMQLRSRAADEFPATGTVVSQAFTTRRK
ncbi:UNVERIFIED_CONTAM: S-adenosylmethionine decarboxylase proenzyme 4 [Sesamum radiatum]|uniref:adenosylmethionine decarboxylase n=1 Tax=Sesamum radiatum TaxID=300843 RepID=A0AAW2S8J8_SESRA